MSPKVELPDRDTYETLLAALQADIGRTMAPAQGEPSIRSKLFASFAHQLGNPHQPWEPKGVIEVSDHFAEYITAYGGRVIKK